MSLRGQLEDLGLAEILYVVGISLRSGELLIDHRGREHRILFRTGRMVASRQGRNARTQAELLESLGLVDQTHFAVLQKQAALQGSNVLALLEAEGRGIAAEIQQRIERDVMAQVEALLQLHEGTFEFSLVGDLAAAAESYGSFVLDEGIAPIRIPAVLERSSGGGLKLGGLGLHATRARRQARLLVAEDEIALPHLKSREPGPPVRSTPPARAQGSRVKKAPPASASGALVALPPSAMGGIVSAAFESAGHASRTAADLAAVLMASNAWAASTEPVVIAQASLASAPGLEVLARTKALRRDATVIVLADSSAPSELARAVEDRASRLGATHVVAFPESDPAFRDHDGVAELVVRLSMREPAPAQAEPVIGLADSASGPEGLYGEDPGAGRPPRISHLPPRQQALALQAVASRLAGVSDLARIAAAILEETADYFARVVLLVRVANRLIPLGACFPTGSLARSSELGRLLRLAADGEDLIARAVRLARPYAGRLPDDPRLKEFVATLGGGAPRHVALMPISDAEGCFGLAFADDAGSAEPLADVSALAHFLSLVAPGLRAGLRAAEQRAEARSLRRAS